jgi:hypothetical protein
MVKRMPSMSPEERRIIVHSFTERAIIAKMTAWAVQSETAFRVMKMEAAFVDEEKQQ